MPKEQRKRVLVVRLDRIGDVVLSTPAIKAIKDAWPDSYVAIMVQPHARSLVEGNPYLDEVIIYNKEGKENSLGGIVRFARAISKKKFDSAVVLHPTTRSHLIVYLAGIPERVGYDRKMAFLLTKRVPATKHFGLKHETDYVLDMLKYIGIEAGEKALFVPVNEANDARVAAAFSFHKISPGDTVVVLNPSASCPSKRWPAERFAKVGDELVKRYGAKIAIIGHEKDIAFSEATGEYMKMKHANLGGMTQVGDMASIFKRADLLISNDSGPVHIACAVGTPVIAIFGRNDRGLSPVRWGPLGEDSIVIHKDVGCRKCLAHKCRIGFKCLDAITVGEVVEAASKVLGRKNTGRLESR